MWLGDKLTKFQIVAMICCFAGITIVTLSDDSPENSSEVVETQDQVSDNSDVNNSGISDYKIGISLSLCAVCLFAVSSVTMRRMRTIHYSAIQFYVALIGFLVSSIWLLVETLTTTRAQFSYSGYSAWLKIIGASCCHFTA